MSIESAIAVQTALTQQAIALEMVKSANKVDQQLVAMIEQAAQSVPVSGRGAVVNVTA
jgi:hypothetical protein